MIQGFRSTLAAGVLGISCIIPEALVADATADENAILEIWSTYSAARVTGDAETWLGLWTLLNGATPLVRRPQPLLTI